MQRAEVHRGWHWTVTRDGCPTLRTFGRARWNAHTFAWMAHFNGSSSSVLKRFAVGAVPLVQMAVYYRNDGSDVRGRIVFERSKTVVAIEHARRACRHWRDWAHTEHKRVTIKQIRQCRKMKTDCASEQSGASRCDQCVWMEAMRLVSAFA